MKTKLLTIISALMCFGVASAQDDIIMLNENVVKAKVEVVGVDIIQYHTADNLDGPIYEVRTADVYMIIFSNGTSKVINPRQTDAPQGDAVANPSIVSDAAPEPIRVAPPEIPVYEQPACPVEGYLWTPGYWAFGPGGYYWVPGVWVMTPHVGYLWTPGFWAFALGVYAWREGYWGEHVGYYGGVNYGYGYGGSDYYGGRWEGETFRYNTAVTRVDVTVVHTTYIDRTVVHEEREGSRSSFNGEGGVSRYETLEDRKYENEKHIEHTAEQREHIEAARNDKSQYVSENHGKPNVVAMNKPNGQHFGTGGEPTTPHPYSQSQPQHTTQPTSQQHQNTETLHQNIQPQHQNTEPPHQNIQPQHQNTQPQKNTQQQHPTAVQNNNQVRNNNSKSQPTSNRPSPKTAKPVPKPQNKQIENKK